MEPITQQETLVSIQNSLRADSSFSVYAKATKVVGDEDSITQDYVYRIISVWDTLDPRYGITFTILDNNGATISCNSNNCAYADWSFSAKYKEGHKDDPSMEVVDEDMKFVEVAHDSDDLDPERQKEVANKIVNGFELFIRKAFIWAPLGLLVFGDVFDSIAASLFVITYFLNEKRNK